MYGARGNACFASIRSREMTQQVDRIRRIQLHRSMIIRLPNLSKRFVSSETKRKVFLFSSIQNVQSLLKRKS